jgi:hypothetical protein
MSDFKNDPQFVFVAHSDLQTGSTAIQAILRDVGSMCEVGFDHTYRIESDFFYFTSSSLGLMSFGMKTFSICEELRYIDNLA